jgi:hypothetical protein
MMYRPMVKPGQAKRWLLSFNPYRHQMVVWLGFIGKMIGFLAGKLADKDIDLALDQKRKAARTFVRLHQILEELRGLSEELAENIDQPMIGGRYRQDWLFDLDERITLLSNEFLHLTNKLHEVIKIFDPNLSMALCGLSYYKSSMLFLASHSFKRLPQENSSAMIEYVYPNPQLMKIDFEEHYRWIVEHPDYFQNRDYDGSQLEWPQDVLLSTFGIEDSTQKDSIRRGTLEEQTKDIKRLRKLLKIHAKIVTEANNRLREFIVATFSIADVL